MTVTDIMMIEYYFVFRFKSPVVTALARRQLFTASTEAGQTVLTPVVTTPGTTSNGTQLPVQEIANFINNLPIY